MRIAAHVLEREATARRRANCWPIEHYPPVAHLAVVGTNDSHGIDTERDDSSAAHLAPLDRPDVLGHDAAKAGLSVGSSAECLEGRDRGGGLSLPRHASSRGRGVTVIDIDPGHLQTLALIKAVVTHPRVWPGFAHDFMGEAHEFVPPWIGRRVYFAARKNKEVIGIFMVSEFQTGLWVGHWAFYPWAKAIDVSIATRQALTLMFSRPDCWMILGLTPRTNKAALYASRRLGFERVGVLRGATRVGGEWTDLVVSAVYPDGF